MNSSHLLPAQKKHNTYGPSEEINYNFPDQIEAVLLAGGKLKDLPTEDTAVPGKGLLPIGDTPLAALTLKALVKSPRIKRIILVSPVKETELKGETWAGIDKVVPAQEHLIDSFKIGLEAVENREHPAMVVCGDLPFVTAQAVTDCVEQCRKRPGYSVWYLYLRREVSEQAYPNIPHTWGKLKEGYFCGTGFMLARPSCLDKVYPILTAMTKARKNPLKLASLLGYWNVFLYLLGQLTIPQAEEAMSRLLGTPCAGIETRYAETAFNIDSAQLLEIARSMVKRKVKA